MNKKSELDCYLYFMWNEWTQSTSIRIFGDSDGKYIWSKWVSACESCGSDGAPALFYSTLDYSTRKEIVNKAVAHYNRA